MSVYLVGVILLVVLAVLLNPANWIRLALMLVGSARRAKVLSSLQQQINAEPDLQRRWLYQRFLDAAAGRKKDD